MGPAPPAVARVPALRIYPALDPGERRRRALLDLYAGWGEPLPALAPLADDAPAFIRDPRI